MPILAVTAKHIPAADDDANRIHRNRALTLFADFGNQIGLGLNPIVIVE